MNNKNLITCEGCGFKVFTRDYQICPICNYESSYSGMLSPSISDSNGGLCLLDYQKWSLKEIDQDVYEYSIGNDVFEKDLKWKAINVNQLDCNRDYYPGYMFQYVKDKNLDFYKKVLSTYNNAQKYNPDDKVHFDSGYLIKN